MKEKILNLFNKSKYITEFLIMISFSLCLYKVITIKAYQNYWNALFIALSIITGILLIANMIYNCKKDKDKIENMFINFVIPVGILFIVFMLPTYTPDASAHIWRAYEVSTGTKFTKIAEDGSSKTTVPLILSESGENEIVTYELLENTINSEDAQDYGKTIQIDTPSKGYSNLLFEGYAVGFWIARILNINVIIGIYIAKLVNFIIVLLLGYLAVKLIPFGKLLLTTYLMIPMMMQQFTAVSGDSLMNAIIILFIAYVLKLAFQEEGLTKKQIAVLMFMTIFIGISKVTYIPVLGVGLILAIRRKDLKIKKKIILICVAIGICLATFFILSFMTKNYTNESAQGYLQEAGVNSEEQIKGIVSNPIGFVGVLFNDLRVNGAQYVTTSIGDYMGWCSIKAPTLYVGLYGLLLICSLFVEDNKEVLKIWEKIWMILLACGMAVLVIAGLYIEWTGVGSQVVAGVQGRYFLPIAILGLLAFCTKKQYIKLRYTSIVMPFAALLINSMFIVNFIKFFV